MAQELHSLVKPISWLIGTWKGINGKGIYPTIKSFDYNEQLEISHPAPNQPVLHLKQDFFSLKTLFSLAISILTFSRLTSWFENPETKSKQFAHFESGFLKANPNSSPLLLTYVSSHNFGLTVIEEGVYDEASKAFSLESTSIGRTSVNKPPEVTKVSF